jgi:hypothetical protein
VAEYDEWNRDFQDLWDEIPGTGYFENDFETSYAMELFDRGFGHSADEYDALGITPDDVHAAREEFFTFMDMDEDQFDWQEWKEIMGYE